MTVCGCPEQLCHHNHAWQDNSWWLELYLTLTGLFTARSSVKPPQDSYRESSADQPCNAFPSHEMRDFLETGGSSSPNTNVPRRAASAHKCLNWLQFGSWVNIWVKYHHLFALLLLPEASAPECRNESGQTFGLTQSCCSSALTTPAIIPVCLGLRSTIHPAGFLLFPPGHGVLNENLTLSSIRWFPHHL